MPRLTATPSQTFGPYFHIGLAPMTTDVIAPPGMPGERVTVQGRVMDGDGKPIADACIEVWQANPEGRYAHPEDTQDKPLYPGFRGFGRISTDDQGRFRFTTVKPGRVPGLPGRAEQAPHLMILVGMRGLLRHLMTRMYFPDDPANAGDHVLNLVEAGRRDTLIARRVPGKEDLLEWNLATQGDAETVFFDL